MVISPERKSKNKNPELLRNSGFGNVWFEVTNTLDQHPPGNFACIQPHTEQLGMRAIAAQVDGNRGQRARGRVCIRTFSGGNAPRARHTLAKSEAGALGARLVGLDRRKHALNLTPTKERRQPFYEIKYHQINKYFIKRSLFAKMCRSIM
jgi:hypothetical protein